MNKSRKYRFYKETFSVARKTIPSGYNNDKKSGTRIEIGSILSDIRADRPLNQGARGSSPDAPPRTKRTGVPVLFVISLVGINLI